MRNQSQQLSISAIIDRSIRLYRNNFGSILLFSLIGVSINILTNVLTGSAGEDPFSGYFDVFSQNIQYSEIITDFSSAFADFEPNFSLYGVVFALVSILIISPLVSGGITFIALGSCHGQRETISGWFALFVPIYPKTILTAVAIIVSGVILFIIFAIGLFLIGMLTSMLVGSIPILSTLTYLLLFVFVLILAVMAVTVFSIVYAAAINDSKFGFSAVGRAWQLVRRRIRKSIAVIFLTNLLMLVFMALLMFLFALLIPNTSTILSTALVYIIHGLCIPISLIAPVFLYLDIIMTTEEYDLSVNRTRYGISAQNNIL